MFGKTRAMELVCGVLVTAVTMLAASAWAVVDMTAAQGVWLFDDSDGNITHDASGNGNDGELILGPALVDGKYGGAVELPGDLGFVDCGDSDSLAFLDAMTISAWVKPLGNGQFNGLMVMKHVGEDDASYGILVFKADWNAPGDIGKVSFSITSGGAEWTDYIGQTVLEDGVWTHVAGTFKPGELFLYINGEIDGAFEPKGDLLSDSGRLIMGTHQAWGEFYYGQLDEVALFDRVLSQEETQEVMADGLGKSLAVSASGKATTTWAAIKKKSI